jgi:hypothetical protein
MAFANHAQPWNQEGREDNPEFADVSAQIVEEMLPAPDSTIDPSVFTESGRHRDTPAAHRHRFFEAKLSEQNETTPMERLSKRLDGGAFHIAIANMRKFGEEWELDPNEIEDRCHEWLPL